MRTEHETAADIKSSSLCWHSQAGLPLVSMLLGWAASLRACAYLDLKRVLGRGSLEPTTGHCEIPGIV